MNKGCWTIIIIGLVLYIIGRIVPEKIVLTGEYCSQKTTVKYPKFAGGGEGWFYKCITLKPDSTCTIVVTQSTYNSSYHLDGKWSELSKGVCKIFGVPDEKDNYNGIYKLKNDELLGQDPVFGIYKKDYTPKTW